MSQPPCPPISLHPLLLVVKGPARDKKVCWLEREWEPRYLGPAKYAAVQEHNNSTSVISLGAPGGPSPSLTRRWSLSEAEYRYRDNSTVACVWSQSVSIWSFYSAFLFLFPSQLLSSLLFAGGVEKVGRCSRIKAVHQTAPLWEPVQRTTVAWQPAGERDQDLQSPENTLLPAQDTTHPARLPTASSTQHSYNRDWLR